MSRTMFSKESAIAGFLRRLMIMGPEYTLLKKFKGAKISEKQIFHSLLTFLSGYKILMRCQNDAKQHVNKAYGEISCKN